MVSSPVTSTTVNLGEAEGGRENFDPDAFLETMDPDRRQVGFQNTTDPKQSSEFVRVFFGSHNLVFEVPWSMSMERNHTSPMTWDYNAILCRLLFKVDLSCYYTAPFGFAQVLDLLSEEAEPLKMGDSTSGANTPQISQTGIEQSFNKTEEKIKEIEPKRYENLRCITDISYHKCIQVQNMIGRTLRTVGTCFSQRGVVIRRAVDGPRWVAQMDNGLGCPLIIFDLFAQNGRTHSSWILMWSFADIW